MTKAFRMGLIALYGEVLMKAGVSLADEDIKPHINSSATVKLTDAQLDKLRKANVPGFVELSAHGNSGAITIHCEKARLFLMDNRPTLTPEEREARTRGKGTGPNVGTKEEQEARRIAREELNRQLAEAYGIQFGKPSDADDVEAEEDDDDTDEA
jgi:hypothetical protein